MQRLVLVLALPCGLVFAMPVPARAIDPDAGPTPQHAAYLYLASEGRMAGAAEQASQLRRLPVSDQPAERRRLQTQIAGADFRVRDAVRDGQVLVYILAGNSDLEADVMARLPSDSEALKEVIEGLHSLWRLARLDPSHVRPRWNRRFQDSEPLDALLGYYQAGAGQYRLDWTYLASINYIESDFGRSTGPSSAGALGPMQFMPGTWQDVGDGDIMSPKDSIRAAARYLNRMGAPANYDRALYRYNNDSDYVEAIEHFATAMRLDPTWLPRLYYWSTYG